MDDFEARRRMNALKKEVWREHHENTQSQHTQNKEGIMQRKLKISALFMGFLASLVSTLVYLIVVILPLVLIMGMFGTPSYSIVRRFQTSVIGIIVLVGGFLVLNWITGYVIARFAKHAPYYNITIYYIIGPAIIVSLWLLAVLLNATRPTTFGLWDILKVMGGVFVAYIGGTFVKRTP